MFSKKNENTVLMSTTPCAPVKRLYRSKIMMCMKVAKMDMAAEKPKTAEKSEVMEKGSKEGDGEVDAAALVAASEEVAHEEVVCFLKALWLIGSRMTCCDCI